MSYFYTIFLTSTLSLICPSHSFLRVSDRIVHVNLFSGSYSPEPTKYFNGPLLTVRHPETNSIVYLVGVSHGSEASASLVSDILAEKRPSAVVLELCEDRFITLSSYAKIRPREDLRLIAAFDNVQKEMTEKIKKYDSKNPFQKSVAVLRFAKEQGPVTGVFVMFGLLVGAMQKLISSSNDDEFTTAIRVANELKIPVRLGDAPQNDTLKSIKNIVSVDTINPSIAIMGALSLAFSAFGLFPGISNMKLNAQQRPPSDILEKSQWVNIPAAYFQSSLLARSLRPVAYLAAALMLIEQLPFMSSSVDAATTTDTLPFPAISWLSTAIDPTVIPYFSSIAVAPVKAYELFERYGNALSLLFLIRMTKIIGTDRDAIIADKVAKACKEFPGQEIVVVIGMLHCNGVARWLMSGVPPLDEPTSALAE